MNVSAKTLLQIFALLGSENPEYDQAKEHDTLLFEERCVNRLMWKQQNEVHATQDEKLKVALQRFGFMYHAKTWLQVFN